MDRELSKVELVDGSEIHTGPNASLEEIRSTIIESFDEYKRGNADVYTEDEAQIEADISSHIKKSLDKKHVQGTQHRWTVALGRSFALNADLPENTVRFSFHTQRYNIFMFRLRVQ